MRCYCLFVHDKSVSNDDDGDGDGDEKGKYLLAMLLLRKICCFFLTKYFPNVLANSLAFYYFIFDIFGIFMA